jgi:DNA-binding NtrC family response regulator
LNPDGTRKQDANGQPIPTQGIAFEALIEELERALIMRASYATKWNQSRTAEMLNLKRDKLRYRMKLYQIGPEAGHAPRDEAA